MPLAIVNPYLAGGIFVDYPVRGRYPLVPKNTTVLPPDRLHPLTSRDDVGENPFGAGFRPGATLSTESPAEETTLKEIMSPE